MTYVENNLTPGESVLYQTGLHWIVLFWYVVIGGFIALVSILAMIGGSIGGFVGLVAGVGLVVLGQVKRKATEMALTNKRVVIKTGLLSRRTVELLLAKVESISVSEGVLGRMLGYGTVVVRGTEGTPELFKGVIQPLEFRKRVQQQIEGQPQSVAPQTVHT